jgi:hypothetical protein
MTKDWIYTLCLITTLTACQTKDKAENQQTKRTYDSTKTAVIPWGFGYPFDSLAYKTTTLSQGDIEQIEKLLLTTVTDYNNSLSAGHEDYRIDLEAKNYKKQLVAVVNSKGEKEVWVNCFCDIDDDTWRKRVVMVSDGGPCFFNFKLNLTTEGTYDLIVNGFA